MAFEKIQVLQLHSKALHIYNPCPIDAHFRLFVESRQNVFQVSRSEITLSPNTSVEVSVTAKLDDPSTFRDTLHILVSDGQDMCVPLSATGSSHLRAQLNSRYKKY